MSITRISIMQPYFLPYMGYWQLIKKADKFIVYDDIQFTKKGWIQRNRLLNKAQAEVFSIHLKKDSDFLSVNQRVISDSYKKEASKLLRKIEMLYKNAPFYEQVQPIIFECISCKELCLFEYIFNSIKVICKALSIDTELIISSSMPECSNLKGQDRVIALCQSLNATHYLNPIGGMSLYDKEVFLREGLMLNFLQSSVSEYKQYSKPFVKDLSIIDVLMFNGIENTKRNLDKMEII